MAGKVAAEIEIDLSPDVLRKAARGNPANLPTFMVHDNASWPMGVVRTDTKNRVHLRRSSFQSVVVPAIPVRPGIWHGLDVQEFHIDLAAHQLDGDGTQEADGYRETREFATDKRLCPECGHWLEDMPDVTENKIRQCTSCSYVEGIETRAMDCACVYDGSVKGCPVGSPWVLCQVCKGSGYVGG